jgi:YidC/Oxa1 family membrane protein insertase
MDSKSIIILVVCFVLLMLGFQLVNKLYPPRPLPPQSTNAVASTVATEGTNVAVASSGTPSGVGAISAPAKAFLRAGTPEELVVVANENARYTFTSHGGGLKTAELVHYPETVSQRRPAVAETARVATLNALAPAPVLALLGDEALQGDGVFKLTMPTPSSVRAEKTLTNGLLLAKEFQMGNDYLVAATVSLENTSTQTLTLSAQELVIGTATPMGPDDNGQAVGVLWYSGARTESINQAWFDNRSLLGCMTGRQMPRSEYRGGNSNVLWAAVNNQFFALAAMPHEPAIQLVCRPLELPHTAATEERAQSRSAPPLRGFETAFVYPQATLAPNQKIERRFYLFAGPKEYRTLARIGNRFNNDLDRIMGFDRALGGRFSAFFAKLLLLSMNGLHQLFNVGYGWVIIGITVIIKALFWPLTQASARSMKRMQALQPQMKAIQEKYKDDPAKMNRKLMEFMKEHRVSPLGGCLPMLLQMPVFIGFYVMIQSAIELRGARFLWVKDLSRPDTLFLVPGLNMRFNLLPLLMGLTMLWQSHMTPQSPGMDPTQQKIMRYMPLIFLFMLYNFAAGLTLYWTVQNLLTIAQMMLTKARQDLAVPVAVAPPQKKRT